MLKEKLQHKHLIVSVGAILALLAVFYFSNNRVLDSVNGKTSLASADIVASEDEEEKEDDVEKEEESSDEDEKEEDTNEEEQDEKEDDLEEEDYEDEDKENYDEQEYEDENYEDEDSEEKESDEDEYNEPEDYEEYEDKNPYQEDEVKYEENTEKQIQQMEKDYKNWEKNLKWKEKDLKRAEKIEERLLKEQERFEKHAEKDEREIDFSYDDYVNWDLLEEVQVELLENFTAYQNHLETLEEYVEDEDSQGFYEYTDTIWLFNLQSNASNACLNSLDQSSWVIDLERYIAEYFYEADLVGTEADSTVIALKESADALLLEAEDLCKDVDALIEDNQDLFDEFLSLDMEGRQDLRFDLQDVESQIWDLQDAIFEQFDDFSTDDPWMIVDEAMQALQFEREGQFIEDEISYMKEQIAAVEEIVLKIQENDGKESNKLIAFDLLEIIDEAYDIITKAEAGLDSEDEQDKEDAFEILGELEDIGREADELIYDLDKDSLEKYLTDEEIDMLFEDSKDKRHGERFEEIGMDEDMAKDMADNISEDEALKMIEILLKKVDMTKFEELINALKDSGESDQLGSIVNVMGRVEDSEVLQNYIDNKQEILEYLDELGDDSDLRSVKALLEDYNFAGDSADKAMAAIDAYLESEKTDEDKDELEETLYDLRDEDIYFKKQNGVISFGDVLENEWYYSNVEDLKEEGVVSGKSGGNYDPSGTLTNAEILKIALKVTGNAENLTEDPNASHWAEKLGYVGRAEELNIDFDADLDDPATRGYVLYLLEEAGKITPEDYSSVGFPDVSVSHQYADFIEYARLQSWVSGDGDTGNFRPDDSLNRAEVSKIVVKFMESFEN